MTADIYRLGFDRCVRGETTVVFKVRPDGARKMDAHLAATGWRAVLPSA